MNLGYADPPYPGCAHLYEGHQDYAGEVDHEALVRRLDDNYDGWILHTSAPATVAVGGIIGEERITAGEVRIVPWVKSFAAFKANVPLAYAWEPCFIRPARKPVVSKRLVMRDWVSCQISLRKGLVGAKPQDVCWHLFEAIGARPEDDLDDIFPGTGAVSKHWAAWRKLFLLPDDNQKAGV